MRWRLFVVVLVVSAREFRGEGDPVVRVISVEERKERREGGGANGDYLVVGKRRWARRLLVR
ncbi:hypothetical protein HAX54_053352, partial [Datura stramonium]|nr:hypothetical protein [Datura stramonium]